MSPIRLEFDKVFIPDLKKLKDNSLNIGSGDLTYSEYVREIVNVDFVKHPGVDVVCDFVKQKLPFKDSSFQNIINTFTLEHVTEPKIVIEEMARVHKKGGKLLLAVPFFEKYHADPNDYWRFTHQGLHYLLDPYYKINVFGIGGRFLTFSHTLAEHNLPNFLINFFYKSALFLGKFEKNKLSWASAFYVVGIRK